MVNRKRILARLMEFFLVGLVAGVTEDIIAIKLATDAEITFQILKVAFLVAVPFAIFSELIVDAKIIRRWVKKKINL